jgi:hypothetical protein
LQVKAGSQISPMLERCCLRVSANVSYQRTAEDIELFTGMRVSAKTQQRLVQRQSFEPPCLEEEVEEVEEVSIDGGTVRLIVQPGEEPRWKQYKAVHLSPEKIHGAWLDEQPFSAVVTCLGDGHDGIWNLFEQMREEVERRELLDWYHLMENLEKVGKSFQHSAQARSLLWEGKVDETLALFEG